MSPISAKHKRVVIVGGGLAGLSAAESLAREGNDRFQITLLESKRSLGGRAGSFTDPATGETIDYCQHAAMGCCTNLLALLERCGQSAVMRRYDKLTFLHPGHPPSKFGPSRLLPAPFHLAASLSALQFLSREQRRQIRYGLWRLLRGGRRALGNQTAAQWLHSHRQDTRTIREFWDVIIVSALGEKTEAVTMSAVHKVFVDGFAAARGASDVCVPAVPLAELCGQRIPNSIGHLGVSLETAKAVNRIEHTAEAVVVEAKDGTRYDTDHVIVAVPWHAIENLLPPRVLPEVHRYASFPSSPISGVHLWFDREITDLPHAVMVGTVAQWLFRDPCGERGTQATSNARGAVDSCYYQVVISAAGESKLMDKAALVETILEELGTAFPPARQAKLVHHRVVTDPNAVFSIRPEVDSDRPNARTPLPWLHLAGDWTATGWPSTMEGAVISGRLAAASVAEQEGAARICVDAGLTRSWLADTIIRS